MKKITKVLALFACLVLSLSFSIACGGGEKYDIMLGSVENGSISVSASSAKEGANVTVTATPDSGYMVESITLDGEELPLNGNKASFKMPAKEVKVSAIFAVDLNSPVVENTSTINPFAIEAPAVRTPAHSKWRFKFTNEGITFAVWVKDAHIYSNDDGIRAYFGLKNYDRVLGDKNLLVQVLHSGAVKTYKVQNGEFVECQVNGVQANVQEWFEPSDTEKSVGFKITLKIAYETLGVTKENAKGNLTMLPAHTNKNSDEIATKESILSGSYSIAKPNTYVVLTDNDTFVPNPLAEQTAQLGSVTGMQKGAYWDNEKDYYPDEPNYANRVVNLTAHDNADNNIFFHNTYGASQMFVEATFKITKLANVSERYGKFGLMLFDGSVSKGTFFYVDAFIGDKNPSLENIQGTELGYVEGNGDWDSFYTIADTMGTFDLSTRTITLKMAYKEGRIYMYCGDTFIMAKDYNASRPVIGIKSFGYGLQVTNYYSTTDANDQKLKDHTPNDIAREIDYLLVGDDALSSWTGYRSYNLGGVANDAVKSEKANTLPNRIEEQEKYYKPKNILISIGANDIYEGNTATKVIERIQMIINDYHEAFPTAKLHFISILPTPAANNKLAIISEVNASVKNIAEEDGLLEYINAESAFLADGNVRPNMFANNGKDLNGDYGYPLWESVVVKALGVSRAQGSEFGDNDSGYAYTNGWSFTENGAVAENNGVNEQVIWYKNAGYNADIYFEAQIYAPENTGADQFPKAGLILRNDKYTIFAYVDLAQTGDFVGMNIVYRPNRGDSFEFAGDWLWQAYEGQGGTGANIAKNFVTIGIAKLNNVVYMLCNGEIVAMHDNIGIKADEEFVVGALNFNRKMYIKNALSIENKMEIADKLGVEIIPEVSLEDAEELGGSGSEHQPSNLTYAVTKYQTSVTVTSGMQYARIYALRTGACVITINGVEVKSIPTLLKINNQRVQVYNVAEYISEGENSVAIITADLHTVVKAKIVIGYEDSESVIATTSEWVSSSSSFALESKPTFYFLGSSVTFGSATNGISFVENVKNTLGYNVVKEAVSGTTLVDGDSTSYVSRMKTLPKDQKVTRLIVQLSTNDVTQGKPFGSIAEGKELSSFNTSTVIGAIEYIIAYAKQTWDCEVIFYTNHKYNNANYNSLIGELYKVQAKWGIGIVDFFNYVDMEELDDSTLASYKADDIHPNAQGYSWMGKVFSEYLQNEVEKDVIRQTIA